MLRIPAFCRIDVRLENTEIQQTHDCGIELCCIQRTANSGCVGIRRREPVEWPYTVHEIEAVNVQGRNCLLRRRVLVGENGLNRVLESAVARTESVILSGLSV
jgi:hypothetical protein